MLDLEMSRWASSGPGAIDLLPIESQVAALAWHSWRFDDSATHSVGPVNTADVARWYAKPPALPPEPTAIEYDVPMDDPRWGTKRY